MGWYCGAGVFALIKWESLSPGLALPTFFNDNNDNNNNMCTVVIGVCNRLINIRKMISSELLDRSRSYISIFNKSYIKNELIIPWHKIYCFIKLNCSNVILIYYLIFFFRKRHTIFEVTNMYLCYVIVNGSRIK